MPSACGTLEVSRQVLEHRSLGRVDAMLFQEAVIDLRQRLGIEVGGGDVEHVLEVMVDLEPLHHRIGMRARAVGEDELAARQLFDRIAELGIGQQRRVIDLVHELQEIVGLHAVLGHQPAHRGAVALVVILLDLERLVLADLQVIRHERADALVDLLPQIEMMRIKRVVEIEHPGLDRIEIAWRGSFQRLHAHCETMQRFPPACKSVERPT